MFIFLLYTILYVALSTCEELTVTDSGVGFIDADDIAMIFYVTLENKSEKEYEVSVCMAHCCDTSNQDEPDCNTMSLIGGDMGLLTPKCSKNVTLIYPNLYLMNRQGQCTVNIRFRNEGAIRQRMSRIDFNTIITPNEDGCECPSLDTDPAQNCRPVDCVVKYSGMKSYFDVKRMRCGYVTKCISPPEQCVPEIGYSLAINNCTNLNSTIGKDDLHLLDNNKTEANECMTCPLGNSICHHGSMDSSGVCECDAGWVTTTDEEIYSPNLLTYHMCNVEVGAWSCLNKSRIKTTTILIAIFAITIASKILILMCILNWCYKRYRHKRDQICSDKLDPNRAEIVLCDELEEFDECICEEGPKKKSHFLESQTMNVTYYPCLPSVNPSIRGSSGSDKCKCSLNSDESIILSKTTSSTAHVYFESESDDVTEASERVKGEVRFDPELSGEGEECSGADEEVREEAFGEGGKSEEEFYEEIEEEGEEQSEYTGYSDNGSRRTTSSKSRSTLHKSRSSVRTKK